MLKVTGAEPVPEDPEEHAPPAKEEGESDARGFCAEEWGSVPGETSEELSDSEYGTPAPDELPYDPYALEFEVRFVRVVEDPPRARGNDARATKKTPRQKSARAARDAPRR